VTLGENEHTDEDVYDRLVGFEEDKKEAFDYRTDLWKEFISPAEAAYSAILLTVSTDQSVEEITSAISESVINPIF
jgi:hypothetical protein